MDESILETTAAVSSAARTFSPLVRILICAAIAIAGGLLCCLLRRKIFPWLQKRAEGISRPGYALICQSFSTPLSRALFLSALYFALLFFPWPSAQAVSVRGLLLQLYRIGLILFIAQGLWNSSSLSALLLRTITRGLDAGTTKTITGFLVNIYKALVAAFALIIILNEFGFDATSLITGLGLIGLTVSLAAQDSASNLFSGLIIILERPFAVGDWVTIGSVEGTVESVNFRSTRVRALDNSLLTVSNSTVCGSIIQNGTRRDRRMYRFTLGVTYDATRPQLEALMQDIRTMLTARSDVFAESVTVELTGFGDSSIDVLVHCYVREANLAKFLTIQNDINLTVMDLMNKNHCSFAFPSTSVYLEKTAAE